MKRIGFSKPKKIKQNEHLINNDNKKNYSQETVA